MYDSIHWQIADQHVEGDSYNDLHDYVMAKAIEYMYLSQERFPTNKIRFQIDNINVTNKIINYVL